MDHMAQEPFSDSILWLRVILTAANDNHDGGARLIVLIIDDTEASVDEDEDQVEREE